MNNTADKEGGSDKFNTLMVKESHCKEVVQWLV